MVGVFILIGSVHEIENRTCDFGNVLNAVPNAGRNDQEAGTHDSQLELIDGAELADSGRGSKSTIRTTPWLTKRRSVVWACVCHAETPPGVNTTWKTWSTGLSSIAQSRLYTSVKKPLALGTFRTSFRDTPTIGELPLFVRRKTRHSGRFFGSVRHSQGLARGGVGRL